MRKLRVTIGGKNLGPALRPFRAEAMVTNRRMSAWMIEAVNAEGS